MTPHLHKATHLVSAGALSRAAETVAGPLD
jgi:hypothetical protein